jgi:predicted PurR-regulated permease PerM
MDQDQRDVYRAALAWVLTAGAAVLAWELRQFFLLAFGALLVAILLRVLASGIARLTGLGMRTSLAAAIFIVLAVIGVIMWRFGAALSGQFNELVSHIQGGVQSLKKTLQDSGFDWTGSNLVAEGASLLTGSIGNLASSGLAFAEAGLIIAVSAVYLSAEPDLYRRGLVRLLRPLGGEQLDRHISKIGRALQLWLLAQLILMLLVGVLTLISLWVIGLPNPVALALIAGLAEAVPYVGPFLSAVPALLVAITLGWGPALWTAAAYIGIHVIEGYLAAPLVERYFVTIPPALVLSGIVLSALVFGTPGIVLAAPMTVAVYVAVRLLYGDEPELK